MLSSILRGPLADGVFPMKASAFLTLLIVLVVSLISPNLSFAGKDKMYRDLQSAKAQRDQYEQELIDQEYSEAEKSPTLAQLLGWVQQRVAAFQKTMSGVQQNYFPLLDAKLTAANAEFDAGIKTPALERILTGVAKNFLS
jgi:hypothetical protein